MLNLREHDINQIEKLNKVELKLCSAVWNIIAYNICLLNILMFLYNSSFGRQRSFKLKKIVELMKLRQRSFTTEEFQVNIVEKSKAYHPINVIIFSYSLI